MQVIKYPAREFWSTLLSRPAIDRKSLFEKVGSIVSEVKQNGDKAVKKYTLQFDKVGIEELEVSQEEIEEASLQIPNQLKEAIEMCRRNIWKFHSAQQHDLPEIQTTPGVVCWQKAMPIEKVGLYVPGGTAPLFSTVLMLGVPAQIAECKEIVLCTPPDKEGKIHPAVLYAAKVAGIHRIFKIGGIQAIAAMAYGTETVPKVYKIFGPGNQYVTAAKQLIALDGIAIDLPAGPSEVMVIADESARPCFLAADLLSQAEHSVDTQSILITVSENLVEPVLLEIEEQLNRIPKKEIALKALENGKIIVLQSLEEAVAMANEYAPEHLIISTRYSLGVASNISNAGSVFLGHYTPESAGDYASGTNHTLPTNGYAKAYSGVNLDSFMRKVTFQQISREGLSNLSNAIILMAENEGLYAHSNAVKVRLDKEESEEKPENRLC
ncbi:MAG TPA: histidinol dehydrogenase [Paludibacteraceae bacterium]|nr:histidinol dehydrogenase [Paludibacteraceae bacterium]HON01978.1 histidinol dehydrogenase [Paludibacteraceae bacterium]HOR39790.1 histidinol dehydrogenase [Paludibacteraceae bacterium]HPD59105.1 histidinol dehydrogenase [Paludibacteraceae bacterium]HPQ12333.1 histidinol dehydrogenase [Paludibacteraceae bacterium]